MSKAAPVSSPRWTLDSSFLQDLQVAVAACHLLQALDAGQQEALQHVLVYLKAAAAASGREAQNATQLQDQYVSILTQGVHNLQIFKFITETLYNLCKQLHGSTTHSRHVANVTLL